MLRTTAPKRLAIRKNAYEGISKAYLLRLAHKAGIEQVSAVVYGETRDYIKKFLTKLLQKAVVIMQHNKNKTLSDSHVMQALASMGEKVYIDPKQATTLKTCVVHQLSKRMKKDPGLKVKARYEHYQGHKTGKACLVIPKAPFLRLLRDELADIETNIRVTSTAGALIQYVTEEYTLRLLEAAHIVTRAKKARTLKNTNLKAITKVPREIHVFQ